MNLPTNALENSVVLGLLADVINCGDILRSCREVNRSWCDRFTKKTFEKLAFAKLENVIRPLPHGIGYCSLTHKFDPAAKVAKIVNLHVRDSTKYFGHPDVLDFFEKCGINLKYLSLQCVQGEKTSAAHFAFLENVLHWCFKLEELKLISLDLEQSDSIDKAWVKLEHPLKKLILDYEKTGLNNNSFPMKNIIRILGQAKNLKSFVCVTSSSDIDRSMFGISSELMTHVSKFCRNLTSLELSGISMNSDAFSVIKSAGFPLINFIFKGYIQDEMAVRNLNETLKACKVSLKLFHIEVNNFCMRNRKQVELNVHELCNLEILKIDTDNVNIGNSGLIGNLQNLKHLTLIGHGGHFSMESDIAKMFKNGNSASLKSVYLEYRSATHVSEILCACPNLVQLEVGGLRRRLRDFISALNLKASGRSCLEDLTIKWFFFKSDILRGDWIMHLLCKLSGYQLRNLKFVGCTTNGYYHPWINCRWLQRGLAANKNTFYRICFDGCNIRAKEFAKIATLLLARTNLVNFTNCYVADDKKIIPLKDCCIFLDNVNDFIYDLRQRFEKM